MGHVNENMDRSKLGQVETKGVSRSRDKFRFRVYG